MQEFDLVSRLRMARGFTTVSSITVHQSVLSCKIGVCSFLAQVMEIEE